MWLFTQNIKQMNKIQLLVDNLDSWMVPYAIDFCENLNTDGYKSLMLHDHDEIENGDVLVLLSCEKKFTQFSKNKHNLIIHESDLPQGKGWSPLTYQVLEGKKDIPMTLFEADDSFDGGNIYLKDFIKLDGTELIEEIREKQAKKSFDLIHLFLKNHSKIKSKVQSGEESFYKRRRQSDSELDINKSILENFNVLRVVDNNRYPAYFIKNGVKYTLNIFKDG